MTPKHSSQSSFPDCFSFELIVLKDCTNFYEYVFKGHCPLGHSINTGMLAVRVVKSLERRIRREAAEGKRITKQTS